MDIAPADQPAVDALWAEYLAATGRDGAFPSAFAYAWWSSASSWCGRGVDSAAWIGSAA
jgi:hypothetical protein